MDFVLGFDFFDFRECDEIVELVEPTEGVFPIVSVRYDRMVEGVNKEDGEIRRGLGRMVHLVSSVS